MMGGAEGLDWLDLLPYWVFRYGLMGVSWAGLGCSLYQVWESVMRFKPYYDRLRPYADRLPKGGDFGDRVKERGRGLLLRLLLRHRRDLLVNGGLLLGVLGLNVVAWFV
jgi:hypothetical protein